MKDNRMYPRIDFHLPIEITGYQGPHMIRDFGLGGLFVETKASTQFKTGNDISLVMKLPLEKDSINVRHRIVRVTNKSIGLEFVNLAPRHAMALEWCFHVFKHTIPLPGT